MKPEQIARELLKLAKDLICAGKKKLYIKDLTEEQLKEYDKIARLNTQGKWEQFSVEMKAFKKKHGYK